ncbi:MAG TPA: hypothetical protein VFU54_19385 [Actinomycetota bacterium]|nr:hypothetical protein [Actinomycetota bacterium]
MRSRGRRRGLALLGVVLAVAALPPPAVAQKAGPGAGPMAAPSALVLVERLSLDDALEATSGRPAATVGFVSTLPGWEPLAARVLSLAAGRRVDAEAAPAQGLPGPAVVERLRADNPDARFGRLPPTRMLAWRGMEAAGLFTLGPSGPASPASPLGHSGGRIPLRPGRLVVLAVPDADALRDVSARLSPGAGAGPVLVAGLRPAPGRANTAPLLVLGGDRVGLPTSDSTRRQGLVALEDLRPTLTGGRSDGDDGTPIRVVGDHGPAAAATWLDRRVGALVLARTLAIPLLALAAVLALLALLAVWRARRRGSGRGRWERTAKGLLALTLALPAGYLAASVAEPLAARAVRAVFQGLFRATGTASAWGLAWLSTGLVVAAVLAGVALWLDRRLPAPALLGAALLALVATGLLAGGEGLAQPLLGGSAWDGERFYGLGNGYFAFALAAAMLVICFTPLRARWAAALLGGLAVVDGLPWLGADVGGALTAMLTAAAALVVLAPAWPRPGRVLLLAGLALVGAVAVALGAGLGGPVTHAGRFVDRLMEGPGEAGRVVADQLARNLRLLLHSPFAWVGPLQVAAAGLVALRPPRALAELSDWLRRVLGLGAFGSLLLILLNDTGVTATAASGLFLLAIPAWALLDHGSAAGPPPPRDAVQPVGVSPSAA